MAIIKCKMCGGDLILTAGVTIAECEYCGTNQTVPNVHSDVIRNLYNRANNLRIKCEFDKAEQIYEKILQEDDAQAEAHWGIVLCKYGIEYVEDPKTYKRIPTCHRTSYESVMASADYQAALTHADVSQKCLYEAEAATIDSVQKSILDVVRNEKPFDVFLCYKETDETGRRTVDSAIANEIYYQLTQEGLKVFYAAITLEDKLGQEYEPYIFAALNSAQVMLVIGTRPEFFTAVWVKNEWSRFMKLMKTNRSKLLIPCYKDMDAYDLPEEFAHLQAQDMGKIGFINDVVRGIRKVLTKETAPAAPVVTVASTPAQPSSAPLLKRSAMFLEDGQWDNAEEYCEKVLDADPECAEAYLIKLLSGNRVSTLEKLAEKRLLLSQQMTYSQQTAAVDTAVRDQAMQTYTVPGYYSPKEILDKYAAFDARYSTAVPCRQRQRQEEASWWEDNYFVGKVARFADQAVAQQLHSTVEKVLATMDERIAQAEKQAEAERQAVLTRYAGVEKTIAETAQLRINKRENDYRKNMDLQDSNSRPDLVQAIDVLKNMGEYKDAPSLIEQYRAQIQVLDDREAAYRAEQAEKQLALAAQARKQRRRKGIIVGSVIGAVLLAILIVVLLTQVIIPGSRYNAAMDQLEQGNYLQARKAFEDLGDFRDSAAQAKACHEAALEEAYNEALALYEAGNFEQAIEAFTALRDYRDSAAQIAICEDGIRHRDYTLGLELIEQGQYAQAHELFVSLGSYQDSPARAKACLVAMDEEVYQQALELMEKKQYQQAYDLFMTISDHSDAAQQAKEALYQVGLAHWEKKEYELSNPIFQSLGAYRDSKQKIHAHDYLSKVTKEPACETEGSQEFTCNDCGYSYTEAIAPTGHTYSESVKRDPTCTQKGEKELRCACGSRTTESIPATGHSYDKGKVTLAAGCTTNGVMTYTCHCGESFTESIKPTGHSYTSEVTTEVGCDTAGVTTFRCDCGDTYTETTPATGHIYTDATCEQDSTCYSCGLFKSAALGHVWKKESSTVARCTRCSGTYDPQITVSSNVPYSKQHVGAGTIVINRVSPRVEILRIDNNKPVVGLYLDISGYYDGNVDELSWRWVSCDVTLYNSAGQVMAATVNFIHCQIKDDGTFSDYVQYLQIPDHTSYRAVLSD